MLVLLALQLHLMQNARRFRAGISCLVVLLVRAADEQCETECESVNTNEQTAKTSDCDRLWQIGRVTVDCPKPNRVPCVRRLLITGTGYSGTHYVRSMLHMGLAINATHENPWKRAEIDVSWPSRYDTDWVRAPLETRSEPHMSSYNFFGEADAIPFSRECMYTHVFHLVRHPLKMINSILHHTTSHPVAKEITKPNMAVWGFIMKATDPRVGWRLASSTLLKTGIERAMLHWYTWNQMLEDVADFRFQVEDTSVNARVLCLRAGWSEKTCTTPPCMGGHEWKLVHELVRFSHNPYQRSVTWGQLEATNASLSAAVWEMAQRYGYKREPTESRGPDPSAFDLAKADAKEKLQKVMMNLLIPGGSPKPGELAKPHPALRVLDPDQRMKEAIKIARSTAASFGLNTCHGDFVNPKLHLPLLSEEL